MDLTINSSELVEKITHGQIGVLPTDTIYGIHGLALNKDIVERIYEVRHRNPQKPFIILISSISDLEKFNITVNQKVKEFLESHWPNKLSVILPCPDQEFSYLHRGTNSLAFRIPKKYDLLKVLDQTGPLISTSVNPEGQEPAKTIEEAKDYFPDLDFYVDQGKIESQPSTLVTINNAGNIEILRQGEVEVKI